MKEVDNFAKKAFRAYFSGCLTTGFFLVGLVSFVIVMMIFIYAGNPLDFSLLGGSLVFVWMFSFAMHKILFIIGLIKECTK